MLLLLTSAESTAISTLALAAFTAYLALSTRRLAREAGEGTRANWRPVLVLETHAGPTGVPFAVDFDDEARVLTVAVRNVGRGPALSITAFVEWPEGKAQRPRLSADVLGPNVDMTMTWEDFERPAPDASFGIAGWQPVQGKITYGDVSYRRHETTFVLGFRIDGVAARLDHHVAMIPGLGPVSARWLGARWVVEHRYRRLRARFTRSVRRGIAA